jgi:molybdopterin-biosynthesis enzyme MoeA-like protein
LLENVVTNIPGFYLQDRYFFTPGFPSMAHPMVVEALDKYYAKNKEKYRYFLKALCSENDLIDTMKLLPPSIDFSSLPQINGDKRAVIISVASYDKDEAKTYFELFTHFLEQNDIQYLLEDH